jgi:hypothetical protein
MCECTEDAPSSGVEVNRRIRRQSSLDHPRAFIRQHFAQICLQRVECAVNGFFPSVKIPRRDHQVAEQRGEIRQPLCDDMLDIALAL